MKHDFLALSIILAIVPVLMAAWRRDLLPAMAFTAVSSIPFAFTETLFYQTYWTPHFLFNLADHIGFGIEDILFVIGLGALSSGAYAFFFRRRLAEGKQISGGPARRAFLLVLASGVLVFLLIVAGMATIHACLLTMGVIGGWILRERPDLVLPALGGSVACGILYAGVLSAMLFGLGRPPSELWRFDGFLGVRVWQIPLEEMLYGLVCGFCGAVFYPWAAHKVYVKLKDDQS